MATVFERIGRGEVIVLDGAMGTELQRRGVPMNRIAWSAVALHTHPEVIGAVHEDYILAGADIIITNSFGASRHVLEPAGLGDRVVSLNRRSVELAREARERVGGAREIAIAGSLSSWIAEGEAKNAPAPEAARASYREQAEVLAEAGADLLILEMMRDVEQSCIMVEAATATGLPVWVGFTCTLRADGAVLLRHREHQLALVDALAPVMATGGSLVAVMHSDLDAIDPALEIVLQRWPGPIAVYPHSGDWTPPNWQFVKVIEPDELARLASHWVERGVQVVGGCCGLGRDHIRALSEQVRGRRVPVRLAP